MPNPTDLTKHDGKPIDWATHAALLEAEIELGYRLTIVQGIGGARASGGTHFEGRAVDCAAWDHARKVRALRKVGFAAWYRPKLIQGGRLIWNAHIHAVLMTGNTLRITQAALNQIVDYKNHRSGLVSNLPDPTWHPDPIKPYQWPGSAGALALEKKAAALLDKPAPKPAPKPAAGLRVDGIDLSHHNAVTAAGLTQAKAAGVRWVYHKASEGHTVLDKTYRARRELVRNVDLPFGAYHFARPSKGETGAGEAVRFLTYAAPAAGDMRPMLDLEDDGGLNKADLTKWTGQFVAEVKRQTGVLPIIYTPFDLADNFGCMLWVARYSNTNAEPKIPAPWKKWRIRQFSNGAYGKPNRVVGMGVIDLNTMHDNEDLDWFRIPVKPVVEPVPPVVVVPKPAEPAPAPADLVVSVTYANVKSLPKMVQADVEADIAKVMSQPGDGAQIVLGAEIVPPRYKTAWVLGATAKNLATYCDTSECPVSLSLAHWAVIESYARKVLGGVPTITPWRPLSMVRATSLLRPDVKLAAMSSHFPNGAWSNKHPLTKALRQSLWNKQWARVQERVAAHVADGYTVVIGFDANRSKLPQLHPAQQVLISDGIDHLLVIPAAGRTVTVKTRSSDDTLNSDHPAITATLTIT